MYTDWLNGLIPFWCRTETKTLSHQQYSQPCHTSAWSPPHLFSIDTSRSRPQSTQSRYLHTDVNHKWLSSGVSEADTSLSSIFCIILASTLMHFDLQKVMEDDKNMIFLRSSLQ